MFSGFLALLLAGFIGGAISPVLVKIGVREIPPITFTALRFLLALIVFIPFYLKKREKLSRKDIYKLSIQSIFFTANVGLFSIAIQYTSAIMSQILYSLVPVSVGVLAFFVLKEKMNKDKLVGSVIAFVGLSFLIFQSITKSDILSFGTPLGNFLNILAVLSWSLYIVLSKKMTKTYSPVTTSFFSFVVTVLILSALIPFELLIRPLHFSDITLTGMGSLMGLAVVSSAFYFFLIQYGIKKTTAFTASLYQYLGPVFAAFTAIPFLHEKPTLPLVFGGILIIAGVFYTTSYSYIKKLVLQ